MQAVIKKFFVNDITTKYGQKKKFDVYIDTDQGEWKFSAWAGQWNQDWNQGVTILLPEMGDQRWKTNEYNGKTQYTLAAPPNTGFAQPASMAPAQAPAPQPMPQPQTAPQQAPVSTSEPSIPVIQVEDTPNQSNEGTLQEILLQVEEILKIVNELKLDKHPLKDSQVQEDMGAKVDDIEF